MKKLCLKLIALVLIVFLGSGMIFAAVYMGLPEAYDNNYQKGFVYQYRVLQNADESIPKIIVIGGSYMSFGVDSEQLSEETGMPAYTLGVHSGMGMAYVIELVKEFINDGDVVIFPFASFAADDYGTDLIFIALESEYDMQMSFYKKHPFLSIKSAGSVVYAKLYNYLKTFVQGNLEQDMTIYNANYFDKTTGNMILEKPERIANPDKFEAYRYSIDESCYSVINDLNAYCKDQGASLLLSYAPMYEGALDHTDAEIQYYENQVKENLDAPFISELEDAIVPLDYIYDGLMHLNDTGVRYYTHKLAEGLIASDTVK